MHELSIINSVVRTLELEFEATKLQKLKSIHLKVGILSNIEPRLLYNAYSTLNYPGSPFEYVALEIESTRIKIHCEPCDSISDVKNYKFFCKKCNRPCKKVIQGEELLIHKVVF